MGRKRKDPRLPKYVYLKKGRYVYVPHLGKGKLGKEILLCPEKSPLSEIWQRYEEVTEIAPGDSLEWLCLEYQKSAKFLSLATSTQKDYKKYHESIMRRAANSNQPYASITPGMLRKYLDNRASENAPVLANREVAYLSAVYTWAIQRDLLPPTFSNPCHKVQRNREKHRTRYISDEEYEIVYNLAISPWYLRPLMEIGYLCRMRPSEARRLLHSDILKEGLYTRRLKGSRDSITKWSPRLRRAVKVAQDHETTIPSLYLFTNKQGCVLTYSAVKSAWDRLMTKALKNGLSERFTIHDLKAKGISDFIGDKQAASGHKTATMIAVYDRKKPEVDSTR